MAKLSTNLPAGPIANTDGTATPAFLAILTTLLTRTGGVVGISASDASAAAQATASQALAKATVAEQEASAAQTSAAAAQAAAAAATMAPARLGAGGAAGVPLTLQDMLLLTLLTSGSARPALADDSAAILALMTRSAT